MRIFAYLDAGTGSVIIQALIGGLVAAVVVIRAYWQKIKTLFGKNKTNKTEDLRGEDA